MSSAAASCPSHFIHSRVCLVCVHCVFCPQYLCVHLHLSVRKSRGLLMFLRWSRKRKKKKFFLFLYDFVTSSLHLFHPDLIHCTNDVNVNIPHLADTLFERTANSSWVVVFKALITTHHLMMYGNEVGGFFTENSQTNQKRQPNKPSKTVN